jgi:hypothetical protein
MTCQLKENKSATVHNILHLKVKLSLFINAIPLIHIDGLEIKLSRFLILAHVSGEVYASSFCKGDCCVREVDVELQTLWISALVGGE